MAEFKGTHEATLADGKTTAPVCAVGNGQFVDAHGHAHWFNEGRVRHLACSKAIESCKCKSKRSADE